MERINRDCLVDIFSITSIKGYQMKAVGVESKANKRRWWFIPEVDLKDSLPMDVVGAKKTYCGFKGRLDKVKEEESTEDY